MLIARIYCHCNLLLTTFFREDKLTSDSVETCLMLLPCNELKGRHVPHASVFICKRTFIFSVF